ncbi:MAG: hypothetical protein RIM84_05655 [Alphaproteobacteria bacterium]
MPPPSRPAAATAGNDGLRWIRLVLPPVYLALLLGGCVGGPTRLTELMMPQTAAAPAAPAAPLYCYRNLARVDCYTGPDPQRRH